MRLQPLDDLVEPPFHSFGRKNYSHLEGVGRAVSTIESAVSRSDASVVIYHRYSLFLDTVAAVLERAGLTVAGTATSPAKALALAAAAAPNFLVVGLDAPPGSSSVLDLVRRASQPPLSIRVLVLGDGAVTHGIDEVLAAGASALIGTSASSEDLVCAMRQTYNPSIHLSRIAAPSAAAAVAPAEQVQLTPRELEILRLAACGYSNRDLALQLRIARQTVKFHLANIYRKLGVANRTQAMHRAERLRLLEPTG